jgi:hypothetical protein
MYKYFTQNNIYRYLDGIYNLLTSYNSVHSTIGMSQAKSTPITYTVWQGINALMTKIPQGHIKFKVEDLVRLTKEKLRFAQVDEQSFSGEIFRVPRSFSACHNLFMNSHTCSLVLLKVFKVTVSPKTELQIYKIVLTRNKCGIKQHITGGKDTRPLILV